MSDTFVNIDGREVFQMVRKAQEVAAEAAAQAPAEDRPTAERVACLALLATSLQLVLRLCGNELSSEQHQAIREAADAGALLGLATFERSRREAELRH